MSETKGRPARRRITRQVGITLPLHLIDLFKSLGGSAWLRGQLEEKMKEIEAKRAAARKTLSEILADDNAPSFPEHFRYAVEGLEMTVEGTDIIVKLDDRDSDRLPDVDDDRGWDVWMNDCLDGPNERFNRAWAKRAMLRAIDSAVVRAFPA